jgi:hypothetical protein
VIDAALKVGSFDAATKARLNAAREAYLFEEERANDSAAFSEHPERMRAALEGKSIAEMITAIDYMLAQEGHGDDRWSAGLEFAKAVLVDGADSIYSPDFPAYELMETATFAGQTTGAHATAQADIDFGLLGAHAEVSRARVKPTNGGAPSPERLV